MPFEATLQEQLGSSWGAALAEEFGKAYFPKLSDFVETAYKTDEVFPQRQNLFKAFELTSFEDTRVVIIGQDPYHEPGQAQGLAFYVPPSVKTPPSLRNIGKELGYIPDLLSWAQQGVLLLNSILTVSSGRAFSHHSKGWEEFTDAVVRALSEKKESLVFILWGASAQKKCRIVDRTKHFIIESAHPSPLSARRGFFGSDPFGKANSYLRSKNYKEIKW